MAARPFTIDRFDPRLTQAFAGLSMDSVERVSAFLNRIARRFGVEIEGIDRLPPGRCLIVANHTFGFDVMFAAAAVFKATGRVVWGLGEHAWWRFPFIRRLAASAGTVDGTQENADRLLQADQLVLVLPGGIREAVKPHELRYRLLWGQRYGFIRAAIRNQAPVVPLAMVGADDLFDLVGDAMRRGRRIRFPIPRPAYGLPILHRVKLKGIFGEPIALGAGPEQEHDTAVLRRCRHEVEGALYELIDTELARRAGIEL
jgi:1-acyl-sn-glycerol-3-phosphate acyltransferase